MGRRRAELRYVGLQNHLLKMPYKDPETQRQYYIRNRETILAKSKAFRDANKEQVSARKKEEYQRNRDKRLDRSKEHWDSLEYWDRKFRNSMAKAYCKASAIVDTDSIKQYFREVFTKEKDVCTYCNETFDIKQITIDHKTPYKLGGRHEISNFVVCCLSCNIRKNATPYPEWIARNQ